MYMYTIFIYIYSKTIEEKTTTKQAELNKDYLRRILQQRYEKKNENN
jgi:hypothetical protein